MGAAEAAAIIGVSRQRLGQLASTSESFPAPEAELVGGRVWATEAIEAWKNDHPVSFSGPKRRKLDAGLYGCLSDSLKRALLEAEHEARGLGHPAVGPLHLLLGLLADPEPPVQAAVDACRLVAPSLRKATSSVYDQRGTSESEKRPLNPAAKEVIQRALLVAFVFRADVVRPEHLLRAIADSPERSTAQALQSLGVRPTALGDSIFAEL